jgi:FkbM family methyltransferase
LPLIERDKPNARIKSFVPTLRQSLTAALLRRYPFYSGAGSLANSQIIATIAGKSDERAWCSTTGGEVLASLNDYVGRAAFFCGDLDPKVSWVCKKLVRPGDTVCDIGANIGIVTLLLSRLVGKQGKVLAFEPNPVCWDALQAAIERNQMTNATALPFALGATSEERTLSIPADNSGAASLNERTVRTSGKTTRVSVRTLDDILAEHNIQSVRFIKLDVEGFESEVFKGSTHVLDKLRPDAILFEMNEPFTPPLVDHPAFDILTRFDYSFMYLPKGLWKVRPRAFDPGEIASLPGHDVIAIPKGHKFDRAVATLKAII